MVSPIEDWFHDWCKQVKADTFDLLTKKERPMSFDKTKPFLAETRYGHNSYETLQEALDNAKRNSAKEFVDTAIYQAIQLVKAPVPGDIVVEKIDVVS